MYAFTVISALCYVIEERKSSVKYWYVLLSLPQEYVYVHNVYVWLKFHYIYIYIYMVALSDCWWWMGTLQVGIKAKVSTLSMDGPC
jgi:hypothetical protein